MEEDPLGYYSRQGPISDPQDEGHHFDQLPRDVSKLREIVQGLVIHVSWASRYGVSVPEDRNQELQLRAVSDKLKQIRKLNGRPVMERRPPEKRLLGNCRDFSIMLCSMLRHLGIPARARCGFATYFLPNHFEDHWICEYWAKTGRWVMVDAQLDDLQRDKLEIDFDPLDVPDDRFIVAGKAWQTCRSGMADADTFGINDLHGLWFVRGNLGRDLASLNKIELLPWDAWGLFDKEEKSISNSDLVLLDRAAVVSQRDNGGFADLRSFYLDNGLLRVPRVIASYVRSGREEVDIGGRFNLQ